MADCVKIESYRGYEIVFDKDKETFSCVIDESQREKKSYSAIKKGIDDYLKSNQGFKPFWVENFAGNSFRDKIQIIGVRKDGKPIYLNSKGEKDTISGWHIDDYILINSDNNPIRKQLAELDGEIEVLRRERLKIVEKVIRVTLKEYLKQLKGETI